MIAKVIVTSNSIEEFDELVEAYRTKYEKLVEEHPSITYTMFVDEDKLELTVKALDLQEAVN